jgi:RNase H-fold protein (predicted Holliday junction resolvase)
VFTRVLAIDPGRAKCGIAVVSREEGVLARTVVAVADVAGIVSDYISRFTPDAIVTGSGTGSDAIAEMVEPLSKAVYIIDENMSTQKARVRYFIDNPPRGWRRFIPRGLLTPPETYDDYAAVILAEIFLCGQEKA